MLLTDESLMSRLEQLLSQSISVDVAVAWATPGKALERLLTFGRTNPGALRSIVGIWGTATEPSALQQLAKAGQLRIPEKTPLFHPKLFLFRKADQLVGWVGSANLTRSGFQQNTELAYEFADDGSGRSWFEERWESLDPDPWPAIKQYVKWRPPNSAKPAQKPSDRSAISETDFYSIAGRVSDWSSFVSAIREANDYWPHRAGVSVDGDSASWLNTIALGHELILRDSWDDLTEQDYRLLMGIKVKSDANTVGYGLLGSMKGAGYAKKVFHKDTPQNLELRGRILEALHSLLSVDPAQFPEKAAQFIQLLNTFDGFSGGIATRFLAITRPDLAISVNNGSSPGIAALTQLPASSLSKGPTASGRGRSYLDLLGFFRNMEWYANPQPTNTYERALSDARAALFDCLVYKPVRQSGR